MATEKRLKKDKEIVVELEAAIKDIRQQLTDQLRCLDQRLDCHVGMLSELQDFYRMSGEVEKELSRGLDKVIRQITARHKADKQRREGWKSYATYETWQTLLELTRQRSKDHTTLSDIYGQLVVNKLADIIEDLQRMHKRCRDVMVTCQDELIKVLTELQSAMKSYHLYHGDSQQAESKLIRVQSQRLRGDQQNLITKRFRNYEKESEKKQLKYAENQLKATKARNDYLLSIDAANAALNKYFVVDVPELINKKEYGYHVMLGQTLDIHAEAERCMNATNQKCIDVISGQSGLIDMSSAHFRTLKMFMTPAKFEFQAHRGDEIQQIKAQMGIQDEIVQRLTLLSDRLKGEKLANQQASTSLTAADHSLMDKISVVDWDIGQMFSDAAGFKPSVDRERKKLERTQAEELFFTKFQDFLRTGSLVVRLHAKYESLQHALGDGTLPPGARLSVLPGKSRKSVFSTLGSKSSSVTRPKLFGGSVEEYAKATGEDVPIVVLSCVRIINLYGMHQQGIFRIPGSQNEINNYKTQFDRGSNPLAEDLDVDDINSVAGLVKLYFRELRSPLFPLSMFDEFVHCSQSYNVTDAAHEKDWLSNVKQLILRLPNTSVILLRYVFAFLSHVSEYSDENMMDAYNLAICFGPTLMPVPEDRDLVHSQTYVNELVKNIIIHHEDIFPLAADGETVYEKWIVASDATEKDFPDQAISEDDAASLNTVVEGNGDVDDENDDHSHVTRTAVAQFNYEGRSSDELSFKAGDVLTLFYRVSSDWWKGSFNDRRGRIPDRYILASDALTNRLKAADGSAGLKLSDSLTKSTECLASSQQHSSPATSPTIHTSHPNLAVTTPVEHPPLPLFRKLSSSGKRDSLSESSCRSPEIMPSPASRVAKEVEDKEGKNTDQGKSVIHEPSQALGNDAATVLISSTNDPTELSLSLESVDGLLAKVLSGIQLLDKELQDQQQQLQQQPNYNSPSQATNKLTPPTKPDPPVRSESSQQSPGSVTVRSDLSLRNHDPSPKSTISPSDTALLSDKSKKSASESFNTKPDIVVESVRKENDQPAIGVIVKEKEQHSVDSTKKQSTEAKSEPVAGSAAADSGASSTATPASAVRPVVFMPGRPVNTSSGFIRSKTSGLAVGTSGSSVKSTTASDVRPLQDFSPTTESQNFVGKPATTDKGPTSTFRSFSGLKSVGKTPVVSGSNVSGGSSNFSTSNEGLRVATGTSCSPREDAENRGTPTSGKYTSNTSNDKVSSTASDVFKNVTVAGNIPLVTATIPSRSSPTCSSSGSGSISSGAAGTAVTSKSSSDSRPAKMFSTLPTRTRPSVDGSTANQESVDNQRPKLQTLFDALQVTQPTEVTISPVVVRSNTSIDKGCETVSSSSSSVVDSPSKMKSRCEKAASLSVSVESWNNNTNVSSEVDSTTSTTISSDSSPSSKLVAGSVFSTFPRSFASKTMWSSVTPPKPITPKPVLVKKSCDGGSMVARGKPPGEVVLEAHVE